jgi:hypothetical protein
VRSREKIHDKSPAKKPGQAFMRPQGCELDSVHLLANVSPDRTVGRELDAPAPVDARLEAAGYDGSR